MKKKISELTVEDLKLFKYPNLKMADIFGVSIDYLLGRKENRALKNFTDKARKAVGDGEVV